MPAERPILGRGNYVTPRCSSPLAGSWCAGDDGGDGGGVSRATARGLRRPELRERSPREAQVFRFPPVPSALSPSDEPPVDLTRYWAHPESSVGLRSAPVSFCTGLRSAPQSPDSSGASWTSSGLSSLSPLSGTSRSPPAPRPLRPPRMAPAPLLPPLPVVAADGGSSLLGRRRRRRRSRSEHAEGSTTPTRSGQNGFSRSMTR